MIQTHPSITELLDEVQAFWWVHKRQFNACMDDDRHIRLVCRECPDAVLSLAQLYRVAEQWGAPALPDETLRMLARAEDDRLEWDIGSPCLPAIQIRKGLLRIFELELEEGVF